MTKITIKSIIITSLTAAFTFAAALIWRDFISALITKIVPPGEEIYYKLIAAIIATIIAIIAIYIVLKTEDEAEIIIRRIKKRKKS